MKPIVLELRWSVSRGRETYGYPICSLWENGRKVASCNGVGYDMVGTVFGAFLTKRFADRLRGLRASYGSRDPNYGKPGHYYGLVFYKGKPTYEQVVAWEPGCSVGVAGSCGMSSVESIAHAIGLKIRWLASPGHNRSTYVVSQREEEED